MALGTAIISLIGAPGAAPTLGSPAVFCCLCLCCPRHPGADFRRGGCSVNRRFPAAAITSLGRLLLACLVLCPLGCAIALKIAEQRPSKTDGWKRRNKFDIAPLTGLDITGPEALPIA